MAEYIRNLIIREADTKTSDKQSANFIMVESNTKATPNDIGGGASFNEAKNGNV